MRQAEDMYKYIFIYHAWFGRGGGGRPISMEQGYTIFFLELLWKDDDNSRVWLGIREKA